MEVVAEMIQQCINENARVVLDQEEYQKRYDGLAQQFESVKAKLEAVTGQINYKETRRATIETFLGTLRRQGGLLTDFDPLLWHSLLDYITVYAKDNVRFTFKDCTEIQA
ncbi:MAG TPA: hypothetical protein VIK78_01195 [Ruminiclostridium sp.]